MVQYITNLNGLLCLVLQRAAADVQRNNEEKRVVRKEEEDVKKSQLQTH